MNTTSEAGFLSNTTIVTGNVTVGVPIQAHTKSHPMSIHYSSAFLWFFVLLFCMYRPSIPEERLIPQQPSNETSEDEERDRESRKKLIEESLVTKKVVSGGASGVVELQDVEETDDTDELSDASVSHGGEDDAQMASELGPNDEVACMICLEPFLEREIVSWSKSMKCRHVFHHKCVFEWLVNSDECPCCRAEYIKFDSQEESQEKTDLSEEINDDAADFAESVGGFFIVDGLVSRVRSAGYAFAKIPSVGDRDGSTKIESDVELAGSSSSFSFGPNGFAAKSPRIPTMTSSDADLEQSKPKRKQTRSRLQLFPRRSTDGYRLAGENESLEESSDTSSTPLCTICRDGSKTEVESGSYHSFSYLADSKNSLDESYESDDDASESPPEKEASQLSPRCVIDV